MVSETASFHLKWTLAVSHCTRTVYQELVPGLGLWSFLQKERLIMTRQCSKHFIWTTFELTFLPPSLPIYTLLEDCSFSESGAAVAQEVQFVSLWCRLKFSSSTLVTSKVGMYALMTTVCWFQFWKSARIMRCLLIPQKLLYNQISQVLMENQPQHNGILLPHICACTCVSVHLCQYNIHRSAKILFLIFARLLNIQAIMLVPKSTFKIHGYQLPHINPHYPD